MADGYTMALAVIIICGLCGIILLERKRRRMLKRKEKELEEQLVRAKMEAEQDGN